jgi:hypothetical protein
MFALFIYFILFISFINLPHYSSGQEMMRYSKLFSRILIRLLGEHKHKR